jgi:integrase
LPLADALGDAIRIFQTGPRESLFGKIEDRFLRIGRHIQSHQNGLSLANHNSSPEAFIFPNKKDGFMDSNNYRKRVLHRLARELELPNLTFQVIRRTIATLAQKKGTVKDIQGVLRHSRMAATTDVYVQEIPESVQKTVDAISAELRLLPNLEEVTRGTSVLLPNATKLKNGVSVST